MLDEPAALEIEGRGMVDGRPVTHLAVPAEDMMQAFANRHLVPSRELLVSVPPQAIVRNAIKILSPQPAKLSGDATVEIRDPCRRRHSWERSSSNCPIRRRV